MHYVAEQETLNEDGLVEGSKTEKKMGENEIK